MRLRLNVVVRSAVERCAFQISSEPVFVGWASLTTSYDRMSFGTRRVRLHLHPGSALVAAGVGKAKNVLTDHSGSGTLVSDLHQNIFARHLGESFQVREGPLEMVEVKLVEVTDISSNISSSHEGSFSLLFEGPTDRPLKQETYSMEHGTMGTFPIFLVPMFSATDGLQYEAVFNRYQA